jgi:hypothetical protein
MDAGARAEGREGGIGRAVSDDRGGGDVVWEGAGGGGFVQEVVRLVSALGLSEEGTTANGGENECAGAEGVEKGLWAAWQAERLRRGEAVVFADEMRLGMLRQVRRGWGRRGEKQRGRIELRYEWRYGVLGVDAMRGRLWWDWVKQVGG